MEQSLMWVGGEHEFALRLGEIRALQNATDAGPEQLYRRIGEGNWRADDLAATIRYGLIGGGMEPKAARELVALMMEQHALLAFKSLAQVILAGALMGPEDDQVGKPLGQSEPRESSSSASSTEVVPKWDSPPQRSTQ